MIETPETLNEDMPKTADPCVPCAASCYAHSFWFTWSLWLMEMYEKHPKFMDKMMLALKYNMSFSDFEVMCK